MGPTGCARPSWPMYCEEHVYGGGYGGSPFWQIALPTWLGTKEPVISKWRLSQRGMIVIAPPRPTGTSKNVAERAAIVGRGGAPGNTATIGACAVVKRP